MLYRVPFSRAKQGDKMREPIFQRISQRGWTNGLGFRSNAVKLSIYQPNSFTGTAPFDAFVSSPAGYTVFKTLEDLVELRQFLDDAISEFSRQTNIIEIRPNAKKSVIEADNMARSEEGNV